MTSTILPAILAAVLCLGAPASAQTLPAGLAPSGADAAPSAFPGPRRARRVVVRRHVAVAEGRSATGVREAVVRAPSDHVPPDHGCRAEVVTIYEPLEDIEKDQNDEMMAILAKEDADHRADGALARKGVVPLRTP